jgi:GrpB protein
LDKIPSNQKVHVKKYDPKTKHISFELIKQIKVLFNDLEVINMGSSALEISGTNDIDLQILSDPKVYSKYLPSLINLLGEPKFQSESLIEWKFKIDSIEVELYLTDKSSPETQRQLKVFKLLNNDTNLCLSYEKLKLKFKNGLLKDYMGAKFEFFNKILSIRVYIFVI